jgi:hypothetical protein
LKKTVCAARLALAVLCAALTFPVLAEDEQPQITEETPYVQSPKVVVDTMLRMAGVRASDFLIDLGSGDGRIPIMAAKRFGARGLGVDLDPPLVELARRNAARDGVADKVAFEVKDIFETDLSKASVVAFYLLPDVAMQLRPRLLKELKPGTRIVAHDYNLGDWPADEWTSIRVPDKPVAPVGISQVFLWVVPADARGRWTSEIGGRRITFDVDQDFQILKARVTSEKAGDDPPLQLRAAGLRGEQISLVVAGRLGGRDGIHHLSGRISGNRIEGEIVTGTRAPERTAWKAERQ